MGANDNENLVLEMTNPDLTVNIEHFWPLVGAAIEAAIMF